MTPGAIPRFAPGMKLREDRARGQWVVMGPERMFVPDETALEILRLVDGRRSIAAIVDDLAARYDAERGLIETDVLALFTDLHGRGVVTGG
ncbi:pyrroloquinoline quinone biosynthesis peptide chaperone PqqD [Siccirubricoccus sp. KC 17139]|uniref:Pyrroloquinoline quinone biosynthesis peptide chaperone PqqD n=1 Tax=Siccirubricoccus soli TaxID=2899147 RepID=A0ABT1D3C3_9PROT|nr:pyrroloquinoline quinone biosynthesis peptide chaperone PqqD [Siccirubricoccus soli]MCO6416420.1 pyrroloquinoline quinone biosynthesis peptide chaperone PqqD [Siccirubricoccus soli]MCP2682554.1 pyrroloquinoline quinone biosynthesis peptide chaperone PqqD [Siccirubricoccus soli]